jgi:phosphopantetheinyl transferase
VEALEHTRISVTHTPDLLLVASMPMDADTDPATFAPRYALGIDAEDAGREQVLKVRSRFLNDEELQAIAADSVEQNILAWTCKEALLKAGTDSATDIRQALRISKLPQIAARPQAKAATGKGVIGADGPTPIELNLFSFRLSGHIVTIAYP